MRSLPATIAAAAFFVLAPAAAANAEAVPFDVTYRLGEQGLEAGVDKTHDTGFVGFCGREPVCTGFGIVVETSKGGAGTSSGNLTLRGYVCVFDMSPECSVDGAAFTGVRITERVVDLPEGSADASLANVSFCLWRNSFYDDPYTCNLRTLPDEGAAMGDTGNVAAPVPQDLGASFGS